jgi:hypothetical protein
MPSLELNGRQAVIVLMTTFGGDSVVPKIGKEKLIEVIKRLTNSAYRAGSEDVIESARAATQWCLGVYLADRESKPEMLRRTLAKSYRCLKIRAC